MPSQVLYVSETNVSETQSAEYIGWRGAIDARLVTREKFETPTELARGAGPRCTARWGWRPAVSDVRLLYISDVERWWWCDRECWRACHKWCWSRSAAQQELGTRQHRLS